jgi:hypothetical protein
MCEVAERIKDQRSAEMARLLPKRSGAGDVAAEPIRWSARLCNKSENIEK